MAHTFQLKVTIPDSVTADEERLIEATFAISEAIVAAAATLRSDNRLTTEPGDDFHDNEYPPTVATIEAWHGVEEKTMRPWYIFKGQYELSPRG